MEGLAALPPVGLYFSTLKIVMMLVLVTPWLWLMPWVAKDARFVRGPHTVWTLAVMGTGMVALVVWLMVPLFAAGLAVYVVATGAVLLTYVVYRNGRVDDPKKKVLTRRHIQSLFGKRDRAEVPAHMVSRVKIYTWDSKIAPQPANDDQMAAYNLVQDLLHGILAARASEADLVPAGTGVRVRFVVDGVIEEHQPLPPADSEAIIQYLKGVGGMSVEDRRRPQQGRISVDLAGSPIDVDLSTTGTTGGQRMRLRITQEVVQLRLDQLGMSKAVLERVRRLGMGSNGLIIVSGRRISGVTSTLYSLIHEQDAFTKQLVTVENEAAIDLENVTQNIYGKTSEQSGLLAAVLRRDPNVVMVDRCAGQATAKAIMKAAAERLILLGASASDSFVALARWVQACGDSAAAVANLRGVLCQVLIRRLCLQCREAYRPDPQLLAKVNLKLGPNDRFYRRPSRPMVDKKGNPIPCQACQGTGYVGRVGVFELLELTDEFKQQLTEGASVSQLKAICRKSKMLYLQEQALQKVIEGVSDLKEMVRATRKSGAAK